LKIKSFNIELTSRCNAKCSLCRNQYSKNRDLPFEDIKNFFTEEVLSNLVTLKLYGSLGDPALHPQFKKIVTYFKKSNPNLVLNISTNGAMYKPSWWRSLGKMLSPTDEVHFGLDGTPTTHSIYRGTDFEKVFYNMKAFIKGGGNAKWLFLCFKHNQHQISDLRKLSELIGATFVPRYSGEYNDMLQKPDIEIEDSPVKELFEPYCPMNDNQIYLKVEGIISPCPFLRIFCDDILEPGKGFYSEKEILINFYKNKDSLDIRKTSYKELCNNDYLKWINDTRPGFTNCKNCGF